LRNQFFAILNTSPGSDALVPSRSAYYLVSTEAVAVNISDNLRKFITEGGGNRPRLHFSVDFQDDWPEEVERFAKVYKDEYLKKSAWKIVDDEMKGVEARIKRRVTDLLPKIRIDIENVVNLAYDTRNITITLKNEIK
jgi:hypothetical protein